MDLKQCFNTILKRKYWIIIITLSATLISAIFSYFIIDPVYKTDISVIIGQSQTNEAKTNQSYNDMLMYQKMVKTYGEFAKSRTVANDVIEKLNLDKSVDQLLSMITVAPKGDTDFLTITVESKSKEEAVEIANQMAKSLKEVSKEVRQADNVQLLDEALSPKSPDSPKPALNMAIAFFLGLMISIGISFLLEYLDNTVKDEEELKELIGLPVIGNIPFIKEGE